MSGTANYLRGCTVAVHLFRPDFLWMTFAALRFVDRNWMDRVAAVVTWNSFSPPPLFAFRCPTQMPWSVLPQSLSSLRCVISRNRRRKCRMSVLQSGVMSTTRSSALRPRSQMIPLLRCPLNPSTLRPPPAPVTSSDHGCVYGRDSWDSISLCTMNCSLCALPFVVVVGSRQIEPFPIYLYCYPCEVRCFINTQQCFLPVHCFQVQLWRLFHCSVMLVVPLCACCCGSRESGGGVGVRSTA